MAIDYEHACKADEGGTKTVSTYAVKAFVKNTAGRVLQTLPLSSHTSEDGRVSWSGNERTITEVVLQPGLGYYVVLAAQVQAGSEKE